MPTLDTPEQLLAALGKSPFSTDPLADLSRAGYTLSPELNRQWQSALQGKKLALPPVGVTPASFKGTLNFQPTSRIAPQVQPAPGNYDVLAGLTFAVANTALNAVYQSGTIPQEIALDQLLSSTALEALTGLFKANQQSGQLRRLQITSAPTLAETTDGSKEVALLIPIQFDWIETISTGITQIEKLITTATGTLQLTMTLIANVVPRANPSFSTMTIGVQLITDATPANSPRLTLNPNSPVQLTSPAAPNQIDGNAVLIQNVLAQQLGSSTVFSVSPVFNLSTGTLALYRSDVVSKSGMLLAGLQMEGTGTTAPTDPSKLESLLPSGSNLYLKVQDPVANALIQTALQSGQLTAIAQQKNSNAVVDSASASFQNNEFVAQIQGRLVNECPLNVDLAFTDTHTVSFQLDGGSIVINQSDNSSILDASNIWCLLTSLGLIGLAILTGGIVGGWLAGIVGGIVGFILTGVGPLLLGQLIGGQGPDSTIVNLTEPIPDSNFLPTLSGGDFQISNGGLLVGAIAGIQPDTTNTIIYVRFLVPAGGIVATATEPLSGVKVELMVQDVPAPPVQVPPGSATGEGIHRVVISYTYVPPTADQQLAVGQTDYTGEVRFGLLVSQLSTTAGYIKEEKTSYDADAQRFITVTTLNPVSVPNPTLYFRVTKQDGSVVDTRQLPGGLMQKFVSARIGTLAKPLTFGGTVTTQNEAARAV